MPYAAVRDLEIYYEWHGPVTAEPLCLFNGAFGVIGENSDWTYQLPRLAQHYRVLVFEHRGHGRTRNPANRFDGYDVLADDAVGLLAALNVPEAIMVGFSDGAITLLDLAQRYPQLVETLVIVGANYYNDDACLQAIETLSPQFIEKTRPAWASSLEQQHARQGVGYWQQLAVQLRALWLKQPTFSKDDLSRIKAPALVMTGQYDQFGNIPQTMDIHHSIKGSELCIVPGAAHPVMRQRPEITTSIILDYLTRQRKKRDRQIST